jgi:hypothetical protein
MPVSRLGDKQFGPTPSVEATRMGFFIPFSSGLKNPAKALCSPPIRPFGGHYDRFYIVYKFVGFVYIYAGFLYVILAIIFSRLSFRAFDDLEHFLVCFLYIPHIPPEPIFVHLAAGTFFPEPARVRGYFVAEKYLAPEPSELKFEIYQVEVLFAEIVLKHVVDLERLFPDYLKLFIVGQLKRLYVV